MIKVVLFGLPSRSFLYKHFLSTFGFELWRGGGVGSANEGGLGIGYKLEYVLFNADGEMSLAAASKKLMCISAPHPFRRVIIGQFRWGVIYSNYNVLCSNIT